MLKTSRENALHKSDMQPKAEENLSDDKISWKSKNISVHEWGKKKKKDFLLISLGSVSSRPPLRCQHSHWTFGGSDTSQMTVI